MIVSIYKHIPKDPNPKSQILKGLMFVKKCLLHILEPRGIEGMFINKKLSAIKENGN